MQSPFVLCSTEISPDINLALGVSSSALSIVAAAFAIMVVGEIDRQQIASTEVMGTATQTDQPPPPPFQFDAVTST